MHHVEEKDYFRKRGKAAVPELVAFLAHDLDPQARVDAAALLGDIGHDAHDAWPALIKAFRDPDPEVRKTAAKSFPLVDPDPLQAPEQLVALFYQPEAQDLAVAAIPPFGESAVRPLADKLDPWQPGIRQCALACLSKLGPKAVGALPRLLAQLGDAAIDNVIVRIGPGALPALCDVAGGREEKKSEAAVACLSRIMPQSRSELIDALKGSNPALRRAAPFALAHLPDSSAISILRVRLEDGPPAERIASAWALGRMDRGDEKVAAAMARAMEDEDPQVRWHAGRGLVGMIETGPAAVMAAVREKPTAELVRLLAEMKQAADKSVPLLLTTVTDRDPEVRAAAAETLGVVGPKEPGVPAAMIALLGDAHEAVRAAAERTLIASGAAALPLIIASMDSPAKAERLDRALGAMDEGAGRTLLDALRDPDQRDLAVLAGRRMNVGALSGIEDGLVDAHVEVRLATMRLLEPGLARMASWVQAFALRAGDPKPEVREEAMAALTRAGPSILPGLVASCWNGPAKETVRKLVSAAGDQAPPVLVPMLVGGSVPAAEVILELGAVAVPEVAKLLRDSNADVRSLGAATLGRFGPAGVSAVPDLAKALVDADDVVRMAAADALGQIGPDAAGACDALDKMAASADPVAAQAARQALAKIRAPR